MKISKIKPVDYKIQIEIDEPKAGVLETSSLTVAKEKGKVVAIGSEVSQVKVGDTVYFKSWAVDIISDDGKKFYFIDEDSKGLCAVIK